MNTNQPVATWPRSSLSEALAAGVPLEMAGSGKEVADRIRQGKAMLEVVSTPWGIEFFLCDVVGRR